MTAAATGTTAEDYYCDCYGMDGPMCDECKADEREQDEHRSADLFLEDVLLYGI